MKIIRLAVVVIVSLLAVGVVGFLIAGKHLYSNLKNGNYIQTWQTADGRILTDIVYDSKDNLKYDLYIPDSVKKGVPIPVMLFIHGGAWIEGRREDYSHACILYAKKGFITATLDYHLQNEKDYSVSIFTMLDDITHCIDAIKKHLEQEGYQPSKLALAGFSAGGHLSLLYSYTRRQESAIPLAFVFEKVGPTVFRKGIWDESFNARVCSILIGKKTSPEEVQTKYQEYLPLLEAVSPALQVTDDAIPTILGYGGKDSLVPAIHRDELVKALEAHKIPHCVVDFPNSSHSMWDDPESTAAFEQAVMDYSAIYFQKL